MPKKTTLLIVVLAYLFAAPSMVLAAPNRTNYSYTYDFDTLDQNWHYAPFPTWTFHNCDGAHGELSQTWYGASGPGFAATLDPYICFWVPVEGVDVNYIWITYTSGRSDGSVHPEHMRGSFVVLSDGNHAYQWAYNDTANPSTGGPNIDVTNGLEIIGVGITAWPSNNFTGDDTIWVDDLTITIAQDGPNDPFAHTNYADNDYLPLRSDVTYEVNHVVSDSPVVDDVHTESGANVYNSFAGQVVAIEPEGGEGYMVKVVGDDDRYTMYSNLETVYPKLNDQIVTGCILGRAGDSFKTPAAGPYTQTPGLLWYYAGTDFYDFGTNQYIDWQNQFVEPLLSAEPCGTTLRTDQCINYNPNLDENARGWKMTNVDTLDVGLSNVRLSKYQSAVGQYVILDHTIDYYVTLNTSLYHDYDYVSVVVQKATDYTIIDVHNVVLDLIAEDLDYGDSLVSEIGPLDLSDWDVNDTYLVSISASNGDTQGVWVDDVCIHDGAAVAGVPTCYFDNYDFNTDNGDGWDASETGVHWRDSPGDFDSDVTLSPGAWISQPVSLASYAGDDATYDLEIVARAGFTPGVDEIIDIFTSGFSADLDLTIETDVEDLGSLHVGNVLIALAQTKTFVVPDTETWIGDLTITNNSLSEQGLILSSVCLKPRTGVWPGGEASVDGTNTDVCDSCAMPGSLDVVAWLSWIWCNLSIFFNCTLTVYLGMFNDWLAAISSQLAWLGRYLALVVSHVALWAMGVLTALGQELIDGLMYALAGAWSVIAGMGIATQVYDTSGVVQAVVESLLVAGGNGLDFAASWFQSLLYLAHLLTVFAASILASLSSEPIVVTLPSCAGTLTGITDGYCFVMLMTNGIVEEFPALTAAFLLIGAVCALLTSMVTLDQLGDIFGDV